MFLTAEDFSFAGVEGNPSSSQFMGQSAMGTFNHIVSGIRIDISVSGAASMAARFLMNVAMHASKGSDIGDMMEKLMRTDMTKLQEGMSVLRSAELIAASHELAAVLRVSSLNINIADPGKQKREIEILQNKIQTLIHDAQVAFSKLETAQEKIRAIQIIISAMVLSAAGGERDAATIRGYMTEELTRLLNLEKVLSDVRHQLSSKASDRALDIKKKRLERLRAM